MADELGKAASVLDPRRGTPAFVSVHRKPYPAIDPTQPSLSAEGKTVLITGGATGIGFSIARNFGAAKASTIVLVARRASSLEAASTELSKKYPSTQILTYAVDIADPSAVASLFKSATSDAHNKSVDIVALSAAYFQSAGTSIGLAVSEIRNSFETNVLGNLNIVREYLSLPNSPSGFTKTILDVSTEAAFTPFPATSAYGATKYCFSFMMRITQNEHPDVNIYSFHPGAIWTPAMQEFGLKKETLEPILDDKELPGRFAVWLAGPDAVFLKGKMLMAKWDVEDLVKNKKAFEEDSLLATVTLKV